MNSKKPRRWRDMLALRCRCQGTVGVVAVPVGGFVEGVLDVVHEIQHGGKKD